MSDQQELPKETNGVVFFIAVNNDFIYVMDHSGYVWSRPASGTEAEWINLGRPPIKK